MPSIPSRRCLWLVAAWAWIGQLSVAMAQADTDTDARALYEQAVEALPNRVELQRLLDEAIALDPELADAYALKAEHYAAQLSVTVARSYVASTANALAELGIANAERARALEPSSLAAHLALGLIHRQYWRWREALEVYERAFEFHPDDPGVLFNYSWLSAFTGNHERALELAERGVALYPQSANAARDLGIVHAYAGNVDASAQALRACIDSDPDMGVCHVYLGFALLRQEDYAAALDSLRWAEQLFGANPSAAAISSLAHAYARAGAPDDAARLFEKLTQRARHGVVGAGSWPLAYLAVGEQERAYEWLNRAVTKIERNQPDEGFFNLMIIKANVQANPVLEQPRFAALRARIGLNE